MSALHNHGAQGIGGAQASPGTTAYTKSVQDAALEAVRRASAFAAAMK